MAKDLKDNMKLKLPELNDKISKFALMTQALILNL